MFTLFAIEGNILTLVMLAFVKPLVSIHSDSPEAVSPTEGSYFHQFRVICL
jgi:hypothetical protein